MILEGLEVGTCQGADLAVFVPGYLIIRLNVRDVTSGLRGVFPARPLSLSERSCVMR